MDGTDIDFANWVEDAVRDGTDQCVQMSLLDKTLGKWADESCKRTALVICEKKQEQLNWRVLVKSIESIEDLEKEQQKTIEYLKQELITVNANIVQQLKDLKYQNQKQQDQLNSLIPLGFLYTQFPNQLKPEELWPNTKWSEITPQYSGLFFRAEGAGSEPFGKTQQANQSWISDVNLQGYYYDYMKALQFEEKIAWTSLRQRQWTDINPSGEQTLYTLKFYMTEGEVRPKNTAIKIWKRIQ